jgi:hypothetical protein
MPVFSSKGAGTSLIRSTSVLGRTVRIKTGHGYHRPHKLQSGQITDLRTSGLTPDQIESPIVQDIEAYLLSGGTIPKVGPAFKGPLARTVGISNIQVSYRTVESPGGIIDVPTYYAT